MGRSLIERRVHQVAHPAVRARLRRTLQRQVESEGLDGEELRAMTDRIVARQLSPRNAFVPACHVPHVRHEPRAAHPASAAGMEKDHTRTPPRSHLHRTDPHIFATDQADPPAISTRPKPTKTRETRHTPFLTTSTPSEMRPLMAKTRRGGARNAGNRYSGVRKGGIRECPLTSVKKQSAGCRKAV